jgi:hypothetical protein
MEYHLSQPATEFLQDEDFESLGSDLVNHLTDSVESDLSSLQNIEPSVKFELFELFVGFFDRISCLALILIRS